MRNALRPSARRLAAILLCASISTGCQPEPSTETNQDNVAEAKPPPALPTAEPPIDRASLLLAVNRAASAHATGAANIEAQRRLNGKQFEIRLRFGCDGQGPGRGDHGWSVDPDGRALRLRAVPSLSLDDELVRSVAGDNVEAAEGFWLKRPWLLDAACPSKASAAPRDAATGDRQEPAARPPRNRDAVGGEDSAAPAPAVQRIGIAHFFTPQDSRTGRRINRPFEAVKQLKEGEVAGTDGFNLILSGRLRARADGRVILCSGEGRDRPPDCIVSADVDRVWIERPSDKEVLAEWTV